MHLVVALVALMASVAFSLVAPGEVPIRTGWYAQVMAPGQALASPLPHEALKAKVSKDGTINVPLAEIAQSPSTLAIGSTYGQEVAETQLPKNYGQFALQVADPLSDSLTATIVAPSAIDAGTPLPVHVFYTVPAGARMTYSELRVFDANDKQVAFKESYVSKPAEGESVLIDQISSEKKPFEPGVYRLKVRMTCDGKEGVKTFEQDMRFYCFDPKVKPLQSALVIRVSIPPLIRPDEPYDDDTISKFMPIAAELSTIMHELQRQEGTRLTLSVPLCTLKDWNQLAWSPSVKDHPEDVVQETDQPRPKARKEERKPYVDQAFYKDLLMVIKNNVDKGKLQVVYSGYDDPDLAIMSEAGALDMLTQSYEEGSIIDGRPLPDIKLAQGAVPSNLSLPNGTVDSLINAGVTWMITLPQGLTLTAEQKKTLSDVYKSKENPQMTIMKANPQTYDKLHGKNYLGLFDSIFSFHISPDVPADHPYVGVFTLTGEKGEATSVMKALRFSHNQPWSITVFASELARYNTGGQVTGITVDTKDPSPWAIAIRDAARDVNTLLYAAGEKLPEYHEANILLYMAQSSGWRLYKNEGTIKAAALAAKASEKARTLMDAIKVSSHPVKLSGKTGDIPVIIKNNNKVELKVIVKAHGNDSLKVTDPKFTEGVVAGTLAGENYISIPVKLTQSNNRDHILTVDLFAGDIPLSSTQVKVISSRMDLLVFLGIALAIFLVLLVMMRFRLNQAGTTETIENSDESMSEIIEKLKQGTLHHSHMTDYDDPEGPVSKAGRSEKNLAMVDTTNGLQKPGVPVTSTPAEEPVAPAEEPTDDADPDATVELAPAEQPADDAGPDAAVEDAAQAGDSTEKPSD